MNLKQLAVTILFARWRRPCTFEDGYSIVLPSPMDMPFLLRYALEGLARLNMDNCRQILVVPDGSVDDRGEGLQRVIDRCGDPRVELIRTRPIDYYLFRRMKPVGGAATHWMMAVIGTAHARCGYAFLHDADAFFLETDGLERHYRACRDRGFFALGVTARWDPFFEAIGYEIPGTWELMFSTRWARSRSPVALKNGRRSTAHGTFEFDSMLYPMYLDHPSGKIGVLDPPPRLVHFSGTIGTYRYFRMGRGKIDELFRLLLLAMLEDLIPSDSGRVVPTVAELVRGLTDPEQPISYDSAVAIEQYPIFRGLLGELCHAPIFEGPRADRLRELVQPFDRHFEPLVAAALARGADAATGRPRRVRTHGLG
jgi:hypothetical protein